MPLADPPQMILHASTVAIAGRGVVICGASGSGKSHLALELMALGADLVADDRTGLWPDPESGAPLAMAPPTLPASIEARGVGLLPARLVGPVPVAVAVDLDKSETNRLPPPRDRILLGHSVALLHNPASGHFAPALLQYVKGISG